MVPGQPQRAPVLHPAAPPPDTDATDPPQEWSGAGERERRHAGAHRRLGIHFPGHLEPGRRPRAVYQADPRPCRKGAPRLCLRLHRRDLPEPDQDGAAAPHHRAGSGRRPGRRVRTRPDQRRDHRRARQQAGPAGSAVQPVPGHGRLQPAVSPTGWRARPAVDPERPGVRGARARGARPGGPGGALRAKAPPRCASTWSAIDGAMARCWPSVASASAVSR